MGDGHFRGGQTRRSQDFLFGGIWRTSARRRYIVARLCKAMLDRLTDQAHIHRNRFGVVPLPENPAEEGERVTPGCSVLVPLRPSGYAPAEPSTLNLNVPQVARTNARVGQTKLPNSTRRVW